MIESSSIRFHCRMTTLASDEIPTLAVVCQLQVGVALNMRVESRLIVKVYSGVSVSSYMCWLKNGISGDRNCSENTLSVMLKYR